MTTVFEYLSQQGDGQECVEALRSLPSAGLHNLKALLDLFDEYAAKIDPTETQPSGNSLVLSEIGNAIRHIMENTPLDSLISYVRREGITRTSISYTSWAFTSSDGNILGAVPTEVPIS